MTTGMVHEKRMSGTVEWYTPRWLFDAIGLEFDVDVCSPGADVVPWIPAKRHITKAEDGLVAEWRGRAWMNHPYGSRDSDWMMKFITHGLRFPGVGICHARTDTPWCKRLINLCDVVVFTKRIQFVDASGNPPLRPNKAGEMVKGSPGCGQMLYAIGKEESAAVRRAASHLKILGVSVKPYPIVE